MNGILREAEEKMQEITDQRERNWSSMMFRNEYDKICFTSMMLIDPSLLVFFVYYLTGIQISFLLTYLVVDLLIFLWWKKEAEKALQEEIEREKAGDRMESIRQKIQELYELDRKLEEEEALQPKEKKKWWQR